ncbi:unnamed protein product [Durusdinium trenchii]|uniref:Methyltransferase FkbM domain-containing protein n=2 Tax=Durusdinium trenchii TaxID=1381693 RepID=A0ABP0SM26_9DINO
MATFDWALPATRNDWLQCNGLSFYCPMTSRMRNWGDLRENLQQHIRLLTDEAWPQEVREARQSLLRPSLAAGWSLTEHAALTRTSYFSGEGSTACHSLQCAQCPIGEVALRTAVLLTSSKEILEALKTPDMPKATRNLVLYSLWDTVGKVDSMLFLEDEITWYDLLESGWPIFGILASLGTLLTGSKFDVRDDFSELRRDLAQLLRPQSSAEEVQSYLGPDQSSYQRWLVYAQQRRSQCFPPTVLGTLLVADGARSMAMPLPMEDFLRIVQSDMRGCRGPMDNLVELLQWPWPLFEAVDWLQTPAMVHVRIQPSQLQQRFRWQPETTGKLVVPRYRRPGTYGFVGDNIRSTGRPHCSLVFQNAFDTLVEFLPQKTAIQVVDVGSMLGDCCLWTLKRLGDMSGAWRSPRCRAYESDELWARLALTSAELNALSHAMTVHHVMVSARGQSSLDALLSDLGDDPWVLKIHTDGSELDLLQGAPRLLSAGRLQFALLRMESQLQLQDGRYRPPPSAWRAWMRSSGLHHHYELRFCHHEALLVAKRQWATRALLSRNLNFTR